MKVNKINPSNLEHGQSKNSRKFLVYEDNNSDDSGVEEDDAQKAKLSWANIAEKAY